MKSLKLFYFIVLLAVSCASMNAQVTIGEDKEANKNALLDLLNPDSGPQKGLLMPRVKLSQRSVPAPLDDFVEGMIVYNTYNSADVSPGFYYVHKSQYEESGTVTDKYEWRKLPFMYEGEWFYLPSARLNVEYKENDPLLGEDAVRELDLYDIYRTNLIEMKASNLRSPHATISPLDYIVYEADDLDYYVTSHDPATFDILGITDMGVLTYKVKKQSDAGTFINIIASVR